MKKCLFALVFVLVLVMPASAFAGPQTICDVKPVYTDYASINFVGSGGVVHTYHRLDGAYPAQGFAWCGVAGTHTVEFWSVDADGVEEAHRTAGFRIFRSTWLTITSSATSARIGTGFVLSGHAAIGLGGEVLRVDVKKPGKAYWSYSSARVVYIASAQESWWYRYTLKRGMAKGTYYFRCLFEGHANYKPSTSGRVAVTVR